jgi:teichoic acid transport system permease protein
MAVLGAIVLATGEPLTWQWLLIVPLLALQTIFNGGLAMLGARLGAKLPDLKQIIPFALRVWMYGSGVLYTVEKFGAIKNPYLREVIEANPALVFIELIRHAMMEDIALASPVWVLWLLAGGWSLLIGVLGFIYFWRGEKEYGRG